MQQKCSLISRMNKVLSRTLKIGRHGIIQQRARDLARSFSSSGSIAVTGQEAIRNIGIVAHIDAGKTTTSEQMLYLCGGINSVGRVDNGNTVLDFLPQERERGITIKSAATSMYWKDYKINLIDTPGHVDFTFEVERSARVLDGVVVIVDAVSGVQAQTRTVWKQSCRQKLPAIAFINKMDRAGASFDLASKSLRDKLNINTLALQLPTFSKDEFTGYVDLISMQHIDLSHMNTANDLNVVMEPVVESSEHFTEATEARKTMLESIAEMDESFMDFYIDNDEHVGLEQEQSTLVIEAIRRLCLSRAAVPMMCGASLKGKGVSSLLDSVISFLPNPLDRPVNIITNKEKDQKREVSATDKELCAMAFKVIHDKSRGPLVYIRNYSGTLQSKQILYNASQKKKERLNQILLVSADDLDRVDSLGPGEVSCCLGESYGYRDYVSVLVVYYFMRSGALDSSDLLLS